MDVMTEDELIDGLGKTVGRYVDGEPDPDVLIRATGTLVAYTLATLVRSSRLLPDQIEAFLADFCTALFQTTLHIVHEEDMQSD